MRNDRRKLLVWRRKGNGQSSQQNRGKEIWRVKGGAESSEQGRMRNASFPNLVNTGIQDTHSHYINVQSSGNGWLLRSATAKIRRLISRKDLEGVFINNGFHNIQIRALGVEMF